MNFSIDLKKKKSLSNQLLMVFPHSVKKFNCGEQFLLLTYSEIQKIIPHNDLKNIISYKDTA